MTNAHLNNETLDDIANSEDILECECLEDKKFRVVFDGDDTGNYIVEFCQRCYDQEDKQYIISMEVIS